MPIFHLVQFKFKPEVDESTISHTCNQMLALKTSCIHPTTGKPYILSSVGGRDISIENLQNGFTHAFIVEFASAADRDFYVEKDEAHAAFVRGVRDAVAGLQVVDFEGGGGGLRVCRLQDILICG